MSSIYLCPRLGLRLCLLPLLRRRLLPGGRTAWLPICSITAVRAAVVLTQLLLLLGGAAIAICKSICVAVRVERAGALWRAAAPALEPALGSLPARRRRRRGRRGRCSRRGSLAREWSGSSLRLAEPFLLGDHRPRASPTVPVAAAVAVVVPVAAAAAAVLARLRRRRRRGLTAAGVKTTPQPRSADSRGASAIRVGGTQAGTETGGGAGCVTPARRRRRLACSSDGGPRQAPPSAPSQQEHLARARAHLRARVLLAVSLTPAAAATPAPAAHDWSPPPRFRVAASTGARRPCVTAAAMRACRSPRWDPVVARHGSGGRGDRRHQSGREAAVHLPSEPHTH